MKIIVLVLILFLNCAKEVSEYEIVCKNKESKECKKYIEYLDSLLERSNNTGHYYIIATW